MQCSIPDQSWAVSVYSVPPGYASHGCPYIKGQRVLDVEYAIAVAASVFCGIAHELVQGSLIDSAGELPEQYMQAVVAGTAASGMLFFGTC